MKVLFIGLGGIGQRHLRNFHRILGDEFEPIAHRVRRESPTLTDSLDVEPGVDVMQKYGVRSVESLVSGLEEDPALVVVANPTSMHVETARAAVGRGLNVFVEKPIGHSADGVAQLVGEVDERGVLGLVGYQLRFHPCIRRAHEIVRGGLLGRVLAVRVWVGEYLPSWHRYEDYRQMYASRANLGGGVILSQIHEVDYLYLFFGLPRTIYTRGGQLSDLELDVEDVASSLMEFRQEGRAFPVHLHQDYVQRPPARGCEIIGSSGKLIVNLTTTTLERYGADGALVEVVSPTDFQRNELFLAQTRHMIACVRGEERPEVSIRDGARSLLVALASRESLATSVVVDVRDFAHQKGLETL